MAKIKKKLRGDGARPATRHRGMAYMEVVIRLYQSPDGVEALKEAFEGGHLSRASIKSALKYMTGQDSKPGNFDEFKEFADSFSDSAGKGRAPAKIGDTRPYKAQKLKTGNTFIRLPLDFLGTKKGIEVYVTFKDENTITVSSKDYRK